MRALKKVCAVSRRYAPAREERRDEVIVPISQLFYNDDGQHIVYVAPNPKTHYEQQLREQGGIGPGTLSPEVKRVPTPVARRAGSARRERARLAARSCATC